jgi:iron complex outermembrane recepter protein
LAMLDRNRDSVGATATTAASKGQDRYRVYTNAKNKYNNFGAALGITYNFYKKFTITGNANFNKMKAQHTGDVFATAFNTPTWMTNLSFGNREIVKNIGFNIVWRWQESFLWESPLVTGTIPSYSVVDAQVTFRFPKLNSQIKTGGANIFNKRYIQYAGGPTIGALYYVAITVEGLLKHQ